MRIVLLKMATLLLAMAFFAIGIFIFYDHFNLHLPETESYSVWLPQNAEIYPKDMVQPGTFKITMPLETFKAKAGDKKVLITYGKEDREIDGKYVVEYWRPTDGGIFHYAKEKIPSPSDSRVNWKISFFKQSAPVSNKGIFSYIPKEKSIMPYFFSAVLLFAGVVFLAFALTKKLTKSSSNCPTKE